MVVVRWSAPPRPEMSLARGLRGLAASLTRPLTSSLPLLSACRTILTVNVHAPSAQSGNDLRAEIKRYEEIASAKLNRMVQTEIRLGTLLPPGRRMKRYSRFTKPKEQRRVAAKAEAWRHFKKKADSYVYWIQYRRRRDQA